MGQNVRVSLQYCNTFFSNRYIKELIKTKDPRAIVETVEELGYSIPSSSMYGIYEYIYNLIAKNYKNEYVFKNILIHKILEGIHLASESIILTELRVANCKADVAVFNGTSTVYEIKTDLDNFSRLQRQLRAYRLFFDKIYVVTTPNQLRNLYKYIDNKIGVVVIHDNESIEAVREARSNKENIDASILFDTLRKKEYMSIISKIYGSVPEVPNTKIYGECKHLFCKLPINIAHQSVIEVLRMRGDKLSSFIDNAPSMFKGYAVGSTLTKKEQQIFTAMM